MSVHNSLLSLAYPMIIHTPLVVSDFLWLDNGQRVALFVYMYMYMQCCVLHAYYTTYSVHVRVLCVHLLCVQIPERLMLTLELLKKELAVATLQQKLGKEVSTYTVDASF